MFELGSLGNHYSVQKIGRYGQAYLGWIKIDPNSEVTQPNTFATPYYRLVVVLICFLMHFNIIYSMV